MQGNPLRTHSAARIIILLIHSLRKKGTNVYPVPIPYTALHMTHTLYSALIHTLVYTLYNVLCTMHYVLCTMLFFVLSTIYCCIVQRIM